MAAVFVGRGDDGVARLEDRVVRADVRLHPGEELHDAVARPEDLLREPQHLALDHVDVGAAAVEPVAGEPDTVAVREERAHGEPRPRADQGVARHEIDAIPQVEVVTAREIEKVFEIGHTALLPTRASEDDVDAGDRHSKWYNAVANAAADRWIVGIRH
jgi:hypothetical protein